MTDTKQTISQRTVTLRVEPEKIPRFSVGTRWEVVSSSVESLWGADFRVTLREIEAAVDVG